MALERKRRTQHKLNQLAYGVQDMVYDVDGVAYEVKRQNEQLGDVNEDLNETDRRIDSQEELIGTVEDDGCCENIWNYIICCGCFKFCCLSPEDAFNVEEQLERRKRVREAQFIRDTRFREERQKDFVFEDTVVELGHAINQLKTRNTTQKERVNNIGGHIQQTTARTKKNNERMKKEEKKRAWW